MADDCGGDLTELANYYVRGDSGSQLHSDFAAIQFVLGVELYDTLNSG